MKLRRSPAKVGVRRRSAETTSTPTWQDDQTIVTQIHTDVSPA